MSNITLETNSFSEQLGIYDFFNVIVSGFIFTMGACFININIKNFLLEDINTSKILGIVVLSYVFGLILQEIAAITEYLLPGLYRKTIKELFKGTPKSNNMDNDIFKNPLVLKHYRNLADMVLNRKILENEKEIQYESRFNNEYVNKFVFSEFQYYIIVNGRNQKFEKMRALYNMSKILGVCFITLAIFTLFSPSYPYVDIIKLLGFKNNFKINFNKFIFVLIFLFVAVLFYIRAKRILRRTLLILLGTYSALIRMEKQNK